jgi:hypothetical protein
MRTKRQRQLVYWGAASLVVLGALAWLLLRASAPDNPYATEPDGRVRGLTDVLERQIDPGMVSFRFEDVAERAGIRFQHFPDRRRSLLPEDMGSGVAWGDYDNDGWIDLFVVNMRGSILDSAEGEGRCALYRNNGDGSFSDVSAAAGMDLAVHGMAAAWGDYDNDGSLDLYLSTYGPNHLLRNNGDGTFSDIGTQAGVADPGFGAGVAWVDFDRDGWLDLYLTNYVQFEYRQADLARAGSQYGTEIPYTLNPSSYAPAPNRLFRNLGDGSFDEVASIAAVSDPEGRSLQPVWFDFDLDGWPDLYVANDVSKNGVFRNLGDGRFMDIGASSLAADYRGAMGLAVADYNRNGSLDLFITHWLAQENVLFENMTGSGFDAKHSDRIFFMEVGESHGLGYSSLRMVGWATGFADFDNDGMTDLWVVNGHTMEERDNREQLIGQPLQLYRQLDGRGFFEIASAAWPEARPMVGRGGAHADFDGDGRVDLAISQHGGRLILLRNVSDSSGNWLALRLRQQQRNRFAVGARVALRIGDRWQTAQVLAGSSYLSQDGSDLHFGLGTATQADALRVHWPDGSVQELGPLASGRVHDLLHDPSY